MKMAIWLEALMIVEIMVCTCVSLIITYKTVIRSEVMHNTTAVRIQRAGKASSIILAYFSSCWWAGNTLLKKVSFCVIQMLLQAPPTLCFFNLIETRCLFCLQLLKLNFRNKSCLEWVTVQSLPGFILPFVQKEQGTSGALGSHMFSYHSMKPHWKHISFLTQLLVPRFILIGKSSQDTNILFSRPSLNQHLT